MKTWLQATAAVAILMVLCQSALAQKVDALAGMGAEPYAWLTGQSPVNTSTNLKPKSLLGRVVVVITFGSGDQRCKNAVQQMNMLNISMRQAGGLVIGTHVHNVDTEATAFFKQLGFPVYQRLTIPEAKIQGDMPIATVFDKTGTLAVKGMKLEDWTPEKLGKEVQELLKQPAPMVEASRTTPYALVDNPLAGENLGESAAKLSTYFKPGGSWGQGCKMLTSMAKKDKDNADIYESMVTSVNDYVNSKIGDMESISGDKPAEALSTLLILDKSTKGMEQNKEVKELISTLTKEDKSVAELAKILTHVAEFDIKFDNLPEKKQQKEGNKLVSTLTKFSERKNVDDSLKAEAENAISFVKALMDGSAVEIDAQGGGGGNFGEAVADKDDKASAKKSKKADADDEDEDDAKGKSKSKRAGKSKKNADDEDADAADDDDGDSKASKKRSSRRGGSRKSKAAASDDDDSDDLFGGDDDSGSKKKSSRSSRSRRNKD